MLLSRSGEKVIFFKKNKKIIVGGYVQKQRRQTCHLSTVLLKNYSHARAFDEVGRIQSAEASSDCKAASPC